MVAQTIHAAGESSPGRGKLPEGTTAVALAVQDEAELLELEEALVCAGIAHSAIREPDPPWNGALMVIGIDPMPREPLRKLLRRLRLLR